MSDIGPIFPPEFGVSIASAGLLALTVALMLLLLVTALLTQKKLPFTRRNAFSLLLGLSLPALFALIALLLAAVGPHSLKQSMGILSDFEITFSALFFLLLGLILGVVKIKRRKA